jgi:hypothetical protein
MTPREHTLRLVIELPLGSVEDGDELRLDCRELARLALAAGVHDPALEPGAAASMTRPVGSLVEARLHARGAHTRRSWLAATAGCRGLPGDVLGGA